VLVLVVVVDLLSLELARVVGTAAGAIVDELGATVVVVVVVELLFGLVVVVVDDLFVPPFVPVPLRRSASWTASLRARTIWRA